MESRILKDIIHNFLQNELKEIRENKVRVVAITIFSLVAIFFMLFNVEEEQINLDDLNKQVQNEDILTEKSSYQKDEKKINNEITATKKDDIVLDGKSVSLVIGADADELVISDPFASSDREKITTEIDDITDIPQQVPIMPTVSPNMQMNLPPIPDFQPTFSEKSQIAEECIKAADVCIFVMNYSNHLTNDEVKFLSQIRQTFAENNKFYSLFITVNRIDERYAAEVEKSVNRILDYISGRLEALDYKNIVIFGTSALQSFYLDKVLGILKADSVEIDEDNPLGDAIRRAKRKHRELMTPLRFVEDALKNLEDFHGIDEPDVKLLENFSGVPQLWRHVKYIGEQKVDTEIVDSVLSRCEMQFAAVRNALLVTGLQDLSKKDKERLADLEQEIITLSNAVARAMSEVDAITSNDGELKIAKADISEEARSIKRAAIRSAKDRSSNIIRNSTLTDGDVEEIQRGNSNSNIDRLFQSLDNLIIQLNKDSEDRLVKLIAVEGSNFSRKVEDAVQNAQQKIIDETERVKNSVPSNTAAGDMMRAFTLPEFPVSLNKLSSSFSGLQSGISYSELRGIAKNSIRIDQETRTRTETRRRESRGLWEGFRSFFGKKYYEDVDVSYTVDIARADAARFKENIKRLLMDSVIGEIEDANDIMEDDVKQKITEVYEDVKAQCAEIGANYQEIFDSFRADIEAAKDETGAHQKAIEHDIVVLVDIEKNIQPFFELWQRIIHGEG